MKTTHALLALAVLGAAANAATAGIWPFHSHSKTCPGKTCCPHAKTETETKTCQTVGCKEICIPAIRFPWMDSCEPRCGKVKTVNVLKEHECEYEKCKYEWKIESHCVDGACIPCKSGASAPSTEEAPAPTPAPPTSARRAPTRLPR